MDIIRNLITDGISPDVLIKRGATRRYVLAVCEDLAKFDVHLVDEQHGEQVVGRAASDSRIGPSSVSHVAGSRVIDMTRSVSSSSSSSMEVNDAIDKMLSPRPAHKPVPSSSWRPAAAASSSVASGPPLVRTDTYKPALLTPAGVSNPITAPRPIQLSHRALPLVTGLPPRPVSSFAPSGPRADQLVRSIHGIAPNTSSTAATPSLGLAAPLTSSSPLPAPASVEANPSTSPIPAVETLAERKKRVLESMKRARKPNVATPIPSTSTPTVQPAADKSTSQPIIAVQDPVPAIPSKFDQEVDALEREVMALQGIKPDDDVETEEGEITPSTAPSVLPTSESLPTRANLDSSTASTNHTNGVRLNRANKRPNAEDLMDNRVKSAKTVYPVKRRPFGRPLPYKHLLVSLDDSDDEMDTRPARQLPPPNDDERLRLEQDIKRLKARIEERRLAKVARLITEKAGSSPAVKDRQESVEEDMDIDEAPASPVTNKAAVVEGDLARNASVWRQFLTG